MKAIRRWKNIHREYNGQWRQSDAGKNMYREYNGQWRQLDAGKICTENTMVNEGNQTL